MVAGAIRGNIVSYLILMAQLLLSHSALRVLASKRVGLTDVADDRRTSARSMSDEAGE